MVPQDKLGEWGLELEFHIVKGGQKSRATKITQAYSENVWPKQLHTKQPIKKERYGGCQIQYRVFFLFTAIFFYYYVHRPYHDTH